MWSGDGLINSLLRHTSTYNKEHYNCWLMLDLRKKNMRFSEIWLCMWKQGDRHVFTSAHMKPFSKSVWIVPAAWGAFDSRRICQHFTCMITNSLSCIARDVQPNIACGIFWIVNIK